nr:MAG TPA: hypothetical protein [Caudoviricetes sp.]
MFVPVLIHIRLLPGQVQTAVLQSVHTFLGIRL